MARPTIFMIVYGLPAKLARLTPLADRLVITMKPNLLNMVCVALLLWIVGCSSTSPGPHEPQPATDQQAEAKQPEGQQPSVATPPRIEKKAPKPPPSDPVNSSARETPKQETPPDATLPEGTAAGLADDSIKARELPLAFSISTAAQQDQQQELAAAYDPRRDGWESEAFHEEANKILKRLAQHLSAGSLDQQTAEKLLDSQIHTSTLRPSLVTVFEDPSFQVRRPQESRFANEHRRWPAVAVALAQLRSPWGESASQESASQEPASQESASGPRIAFKQFRIDFENEVPTSTVFYTAVGQTSDGRLQQNATWKCLWATGEPTIPASELPPGVIPRGKIEPGVIRLKAIELIAYEEILLRSESPLLVDCTTAALGGNECFAAQLRYGANHWLERIPLYSQDALQGVTVGDLNNDGLEDLYLPQGLGLPNRLFLLQPDGTFLEKARQYHVDFLDETRSALFVDLDNDGDQDLVVVTEQLLVVLENTGPEHTGPEHTGPENTDSETKPDEKLVERFRLPVVDAMSVAAGDVDGDGLLDLYVCGYTNALHEIGVVANPVPYHDAKNGAANLMLRNEGQLQFLNVTKAWNLSENNTRFTFACAFEDYDRDGDLDLYVVNDFGRNNLYTNVAKRGHSPQFVDLAAKQGVEDCSFGMSAAWGDANRDGRMDLYVSNMFSAAGNRVTYQRHFMDGSSQEKLDSVRYLARGNSLFLNQGDGFLDDSPAAGVQNAQWSWASKFCDLNNDGWADVLAANGYLTGPEVGDL